jgi:hypothetical protein
MSKSVNVIINSQNVVSGDAQYATYYFDWLSVLDRNKKYKMHWTYLGGQNTYTGSKLATVYLGINTNSYNAGASSNYGNTLCIGFLKPIVLVGASNLVYLQAEDNTNLPIHLDSCPLNNTFTVGIYTNAVPPALWTDNAATPIKPANYILTLKFIEVEEMED